MNMDLNSNDNVSTVQLKVTYLKVNCNNVDSRPLRPKDTKLTITKPSPVIKNHDQTLLVADPRRKVRFP